MTVYPEMPPLAWIPGTGLKLFSRKMYRLLDDYEITISGRTYRIPKGFCFDGMSAPTPAKPFLSEAAEYSLAALVHDWLYWSNIVTKEEADAVFHTVLRDFDSVRRLDYTASWAILILFGQAAFDEHRRLGHSADFVPQEDGM